MIYIKRSGDYRYGDRYGETPFNFKKPPLEKWRTPHTTLSCNCCGSTRNPDAFILIPGTTLCQMDGEGRTRSLFCLGCLEEMYKYYVEQDPERNRYRSLYRICMLCSAYYDDALAHQVIDEEGFYEDGTPIPEKMGVVDRYMRTIMNHPEYKTKDFWASDNLLFDQVIAQQRELNTLSKQGRENRSQILAVFHEDPFEKEPIEEREKLYNDLITMTDDAMNEDLVRQKAAIEIVRAFYHINKISEAISQLQATPESTIKNDKTLKTLIEQKTKETQMVTNFSKDHGFAEKYALAKSKGSGTLSAIVRDMKDAHFDPCIINKYDIETSEAIKQISDISAESIFKQIQFSDSEYASMVKEQAEELRKLRDEKERIEEELRMYKEKHLKQELLDELRKELENKGIPVDDIDHIISKEITTNDDDSWGQ